MKKIAIFLIIIITFLSSTEILAQNENLVKNDDIMTKENLEKYEKIFIDDKEFFHTVKDDKVRLYISTDNSVKEDNTILFLRLNAEEIDGKEMKVSDISYQCFEIDKKLIKPEENLLEVLKAVELDYKHKETIPLNGNISSDIINIDSEKEEITTEQIKDNDIEPEKNENIVQDNEIKAVIEKQNEEKQNADISTKSAHTVTQNGPKETKNELQNKPVNNGEQNSNDKKGKILRAFKKVNINGLQDLVGINNELVKEESKPDTIEKSIPHRTTGELKSEPRKLSNVDAPKDFEKSISKNTGKNSFNDYLAVLGLVLSVSGVVVRKKSRWRN